ncbi:MAG: type II toxin-antitoxin system RelE/ParE family toxin [Polyangia bacterium]
MTPLFTEAFQRRLFVIVDAYENRRAAARFLEKLEAAVTRACAFPRSGLPLPEFPHPLVRQFLIDRYRCFYLISERRKEIILVSVWHSAQIADPPELPADL